MLIFENFQAMHIFKQALIIARVRYVINHYVHTLAIALFVTHSCYFFRDQSVGFFSRISMNIKKHVNFKLSLSVPFTEIKRCYRL